MLENDQWAMGEAPRPSAEDRARQRIVARVLQRVGSDAESQGRWLLSVGHLDLGGLSEKERATIDRELLVFLEAEPLPGISSNKRFAEHVSRGIFLLAGQIPSAGELVLPATDTARTHEWLRKGLADIEGGRGFPFDVAVKAVVRLSPSAAEGEVAPLQFGKLRSGSDVHERFAYRAYETLRTCGHAIRRCVACKELFVRGHGLEVYCSKRCSQRVRTRAWRKTHPEKAKELRQRQYEAEVARKYGPEAIGHIRRHKGA
jgi:hypothetical protein